jgi:hypothetical protein
MKLKMRNIYYYILFTKIDKGIGGERTLQVFNLFCHYGGRKIDIVSSFFVKGFIVNGLKNE